MGQLKNIQLTLLENNIDLDTPLALKTAYLLMDGQRIVKAFADKALADFELSVCAQGTEYGDEGDYWLNTVDIDCTPLDYLMNH